jgi:MFS family permease
MNTALLRLALCQGLFLTNNVTFIAINGLVGLALAPLPWMATLPVAGYVAGGALSTALVARHQQRYGRRRGFQLGLLVAVASTLVCAWAATSRNFTLLVAATVVAGYYNANAGLYRFAAVELVDAARKEKAISWVLAGGIIGAVAGPNLANATRDVLPGAPFAGAYLALAAVALLGLVLISTIDFPPLAGQGTVGGAGAGRPLRLIVAQPVFIVAAAGCALGYGVMNLLMAATPIAMAQHAHDFSAAALVLEWHVLGMFVPSFFTGSLIKRVGVLPVMAAGVLLNFICIAVALSGVELMHFLGALFALGVGWNFLFIGGTTLATQAYAPEEKTRAQAALDFCVFTTMTITSFGSGALVTTGGWQAMNWGSLVPMALLVAALVWLARLSPRTQNRRTT